MPTGLASVSMPGYHVNTLKHDGRNEVHVDGCSWAPEPVHRRELGEHPDCRAAVAQARRLDGSRRVVGCPHCCPECRPGSSRMRLKARGA